MIEMAQLTPRAEAIASYREQAKRLIEISGMCLEAEDLERAKEAARYADVCIRAAIQERVNKRPPGLPEPA